MKRRTVTTLIMVLVAIGTWQVGHGAWIYVKARLAQYLLQHAWVRTMNEERNVKPWPWADTWPVVRLQAARHTVDLIVLAGASGRTLAFGPAILNDGIEKNGHGTLVISGHRDTNFQFVQKLRDGDELLIEQPGQPRRVYRVTEAQVIDSRTTGIMNNPDQDRLLLVTCYPFDAIIPGGPLRYVVTAERVE
jgi:sortase A